MLNSEVKIYMLLLEKRISGYMVENSYIDNLYIQKAGIPGFSGCIEHTSVIGQLIKEANTTPWQRVEKGIETRCTVSPILFVMGKGMVTRAAKRN